MAEVSETPESENWAADWSAIHLTAKEKDSFEDVIANLYDWIALSDESCYLEAKKQCDSLAPGVTEDRATCFYSAVLRYIIVELVMCCEPDEQSNVNEKLKKLAFFVEDITTDKRKLGVEQINQEILDICKDEDVYPLLAGDNDSQNDSKLGLSLFANFHCFAMKMYRKKLLTHVAPAFRALDAYFGETQNRNDEVFYAVTQWLTYAPHDIYNFDEDVPENWESWYFEICKRTAQYSRNEGDKEAMRLYICGRTSEKGMEDMSQKLRDFNKLARESAQGIGRLQGNTDVANMEDRQS